MSAQRPRLLFVSPRFLFPADSGGKIRTSQILRGMKGGRFEITLLSPQAPGAEQRFAEELTAVADHFVSWPEQQRGLLHSLARLRHVFSSVPIPVATDRSAVGSKVVAAQLARQPDVVVFDFPHAAVLAPARISAPSVMFTHNVEAEIFRRHAQHAANPLKKAVWQNQLRKMEQFERDTLARFDKVVAVSDRDADQLKRASGNPDIEVIPTGVDLDFFSYSAPGDTGSIVFTGSMDWLANIDGIEFMMNDICTLPALHNVTMTVVGRSPPRTLVEQAKSSNLPWQFTGFVDDVRPYVRAASVYAIPLRVGGGTRIKVFEAMAMGCPVVSTAIGVEGLPLQAGVHYLEANSAAEFAAALQRLLNDQALREQLSRAARQYVDEHFSFRKVAIEFENICLRAAHQRGRLAGVA